MWYFIIQRNEINKYRHYQPWTLLDFDQSQGASLLHRQHTLQWQRDILENELVTNMVKTADNKTNEKICIITSYLKEVEHIFHVATRVIKNFEQYTYVVGYIKDKTMRIKEFESSIEANEAFLKIEKMKLPTICITRGRACFNSIKLYRMNLQRKLGYLCNEEIGIRVDLNEDDPYYDTDVFIVSLEDVKGNTISVSCQIDFIELRK